MKNPVDTRPGHTETDIDCVHCGFNLIEWELKYSKIYCTVCPGLGYPEFVPFAKWED